MQREYGFGAWSRIQRISVWVTAVLGVIYLVVAASTERDVDQWGFAAFAAFMFVIAIGLQRALRTMNEFVIALHAEGVRYAHLPESELIPWSSIRNIRERPVLQRLDLIDAHGQTTIQLHYQLVGFAELRDHLLTHVPIAVPTPVRFRRSCGIDVLLLLLSLFPPLIFVVIYEQRKSPYAVQITDSELVLSMLFRTVTIPLQELKVTSKTQNHQGMLIPLLEVRHSPTGKPITLRKVGADMIVLKATLEEAMRTHPYARKTSHTPFRSKEVSARS